MLFNCIHIQEIDNNNYIITNYMHMCVCICRIHWCAMCSFEL